MSVGKVVEECIVPAGITVGRCRSGTVTAGEIARQAASVVGGVVGRRTVGNAAAVLGVVDAVAAALVRSALMTSPTLRMTRHTRLRHIHDRLAPGGNK